MTFKNGFRNLGLILIICFSAEAAATRAYIKDLKISQVRMYGNGTYGGCVAVVDKSLNTSGDVVLSCVEDRLISFDCEGTLGTKASRAQNAFNLAQLAKVTDGTVDMYVEDSNLLNGKVCFSNFMVVR